MNEKIIKFNNLPNYGSNPIVLSFKDPTKDPNDPAGKAFILFYIARREASVEMSFGSLDNNSTQTVSAEMHYETIFTFKFTHQATKYLLPELKQYLAEYCISGYITQPEPAHLTLQVRAPLVAQDPFTIGMSKEALSKYSALYDTLLTHYAGAQLALCKLLTKHSNAFELSDEYFLTEEAKKSSIVLNTLQALKAGNAPDKAVEVTLSTMVEVGKIKKDTAANYLKQFNNPNTKEIKVNFADLEELCYLAEDSKLIYKKAAYDMSSGGNSNIVSNMISIRDKEGHLQSQPTSIEITPPQSGPGAL